MAERYPSSKNDVKLELCRFYQQDPKSCPTGQCSDLHICRDYLLKTECSKFKADGQCSHWHSLFTRHNQQILERKLKLSAENDNTFERVAQLIRTSASGSPGKGSSQVGRSRLFDDEQDSNSVGFQTSIMRSGPTTDLGGRSLLKKTSSDKSLLTDTERLSLAPRVSLLSSCDHPRHSLSDPLDLPPTFTQFSTSRSLDLLDRCDDSSRKSNPLTALSTYRPDEHNDRPRIVDDVDGDSDPHSAGSGSRRVKSFRSTTHVFLSRVKDRFSPKSGSRHTSSTDSQMKYIFHKYVRDDELSFLHGPIRRDLVERWKFQVVPSGYCYLADAIQEREIEQRLQVLLPRVLYTRPVDLPNDELAFFICSSAAEGIFEQNQITYSIISQPYTRPSSIRVIRMANDGHSRFASVPPRKPVAARFIDDGESPPLRTSDAKFVIPQYNSSIDAIEADITKVQVQLMVCVTTSATLLDSILRNAGPGVTEEYQRRFSSSTPLMLDGGHTQAEKILFVPWRLAVESSNSIHAQKSLSNLVKRCIDQAHQLHITSIAFPSIGTGEIGLDPDKVSESMINAASECLYKYRMDVLFVIYPSSGPNQQSFRAFRAYLNNLRRQNNSARPITPTMPSSSQDLTISAGKTEHIQSNTDCKRIFTVSESSDMIFDHQQLARFLERLIVRKTFALSLVQKSFVDQVNMLIALCLDYHVLPYIDFVKDELTLHGDQNSCSQCSMNLRSRGGVYKYSISKKTEKKTEEIELNTHVSMKIDEAYINHDSDIHIKDDNTDYRVDLTNWKIHINDDVQSFPLIRERLDDSRTVLPPSWSTLLMIRMVGFKLSSSSSMECLHLFQRTMPKEEWPIERVDIIENWPLYVHYTAKKNKDETIAFHACSYSSVQSIIHYGLHSNCDQSSDNSIDLTHDALSSHIRNARRSIDGKYYIFAVRLPKKLLHHDAVSLSNKDGHLALPTHLFVYRREILV